ncbi:hypothetical protein HDF11_004798 [Tunturiibacter psychrotolerans]
MTKFFLLIVYLPTFAFPKVFKVVPNLSTYGGASCT